MKKKVVLIILTATLAAVMPFSVLAARSISGGGSGGGGSSTTKTTATTTGTPTTTADGQSLVTNGAGSQVSGVEALFAVGEGATAGLPEQVVSSITSINAGANLALAVGNAELAGYSALVKTAAVVLKNTATGAVANQEVAVSLYIPNLISGLQNIKILCYENATGIWRVIEPTAINYENKTVTFNMYGSGTVIVIHK